MAYSGDTGPDPMLAELGRDCNLFIIEATDRDGESRAASTAAAEFGRDVLTAEEGLTVRLGH